MVEKESHFHRFAKLNERGEEIHLYAINKGPGKGTIVRCMLGEGLEMHFFDYEVEENKSISGFNNEDALEIFYCIEGNVRLNYADSFCRLTDNIIGIYDFSSCPHSIIFESRRFIGISLLLKGMAAEDIISRYIGRSGMSLAEMKALVLQNKEAFTCFGNREIRKVFLGIAENPLGYDIDFLRLKAMELILISSRSLSRMLAERPKLQKRTLDLRIFDKATRYMSENLIENLTIEQIAEEVGISTTKLQKIFYYFCGQSVYSNFRSIRLNKAKQLLQQSDLSITDVAAEVGWQNPSKFSAAFKSEYGNTPRQFRKMI